LSDPTTGECTVFIGWHIEQGHADGIDLSGLTVARAIHTPGPMLEVPWTAALYIDDRASKAQAQALTEIFTGQRGGSPAKLASHIVNDLGVSHVAITFTANGKKRAVSIPNVVEVEITALVGQGEGDVTVSGHPMCVAPGHAAVVSRSSHLKYSDHGLTWEISEKTGFFSPFTYAGP
jgi:hypothetical protein